tara:strand:+ start:676 stop:1197 length:522 start_codon:yes stop_codon:yes gene_type:complete
MSERASIYICNLAELDRHVSRISPSHVVSLLTQSHMPATPVGITGDNHLKIVCHDIVQPFEGAVVPGDQHVQLLLDFAARWPGDAPMLIHCFAGVSRSTAAALVIGAVHFKGDMATLAQRLRAAAPHAHPNTRIVAVADRMLGLGGELVSAVEGIGYGTLVDRAPLTELSLAI